MTELAPATAGWPRTDALSAQNALSHGDLLLARSQVRARCELSATVTDPRTMGKLQAAVVAITGVDLPVSTGLTRSNSVPIDRARRGSQ